MSDARMSGNIQSELVERASRDPQFRQELIGDPRGVLAREYGIQVPAGATITVLEETPTDIYLVLPAAPFTTKKPLSEEDLEKAAGGKCTGTAPG